MSELKKLFDEQGYVVLREIIRADECERYIIALKEIGKHKKKATWTVPDGAVQHEQFWPLILDEEVLGKVRELLGEGFKFLQHNDLHLGYSSFAWHRDGVNRSYDPEWPEWKEDHEPYQILRCGFYFQPRENNFHLGVLPGSHRLSGHLSEQDFLEQNKYLSNLNNAKAKVGLKDVLKEKANWILTSPGDCIVFDPRLIHTGGEFQAHKYSIFTAYGLPNRHMEAHYTYYRHLRYDLGYGDMPEGLRHKLQSREIYFEEKKYVDHIEGAWIPSKLYAKVSKLFT